MTIQNAADIIHRLGPCRIALDRAGHAELARELAMLGCEVTDVPDGAAARADGNRALAGLLEWPRPGGPAAFADALRPYRGMDTLVLHAGGQARRPVEEQLFADGWQRHPAGMMAHEYGAFTGTALPTAAFYRKAGGGFGRRAGMLQRSDADADAFILRHGVAAQVVRTGDHVLVDGLDTVDGAAVLGALSRAGAIVSIAKAGARAAGRTVESDLAGIADGSIHMIVNFEASVPLGGDARLDDYLRVLALDGRVLLGWRQSDGGSWEDFAEAVSARFLIEARYAQILPGTHGGSPGGFYPLEVEGDSPAERQILLAHANPLDGGERREEYAHPAFPIPECGGRRLVDFRAAYDNPYLYRSMVQMGERLRDEILLSRLAECVIEDSRPGSADRGAAIAVLGYRVLERRMADAAANIHALIAAFREDSAGSALPHVQRWRVSLAFLAARLFEMIEDRAGAVEWYRAAAEGEWQSFSPLLATKAVAACFFEGRLHLAGGDREAATSRFQRGVAIALAAAGADHGDAMGDPDRPLPFYLQELAEVIDMGSQCANAVAHIDLWDRDPGLFWRQVDVRRFGLASWARELELENDRLRQRG